MIRAIYLNLFIGIHTLIFCLWGLLLSLFDQKGRVIHFYCAAPWAKIILWVCGARVTFKGLENVDPGVPRIYMCNHQSYFDVFALMAYLPVELKFIMKQELVRLPIFGLTVKRAKHIGIDRKDPRRAVEGLKQAVERIRNGVPVLIFPEGTRSVDGRLQAFKRGGFNLALRSGCDIVPLGVTNSYRIQPKGSLRISKGSFSIHIGRPISVQGYSRKNLTELMDRVREAIMRLMNEGNADE